MADNTRLNVGSGGDIIATDEIDGVKHQRVKIQYGTDGTAVDCSDLNPLPTKTSIVDSAALDAFGRLRCSSPSNILDVKQLYDKQPLFYDESITNTSGNATSTHSTVNAATTMHAGVNDTIIRQTKMRYNYQPGKSQLILMTGVLGSGVSGLKRRIGCFDDNNGLFFELDGTDFYVVIRKNGSDTRISQGNWNIDTFDGSGSSGLTLDLSKVQIFVIDYEWLGAGRVRFGFAIYGLIFYCHYALHANVVSSVYTSTSNHPVRYEITSSGGVGDLVHICTSVISEGGLEPLGVKRSHSTGNIQLDADVADTVYAVLGVRLKSTHLAATVLPSDITMISESSNQFRWILSFNPTVSGTFTYGDLSNSACQTATGVTANAVSDLGIIISQGYATGATGMISIEPNNSLYLGAKIDGTRDTLVLSVMPLSSSTDIQASMNWRELL